MNKTLSSLTLVAGFGLSACAADDEDEIRLEKGLIDRATILDGVEVRLIAGNLAMFEVPFAEPVPEVTEVEFASAMEMAASVQVVDVVAKTSQWLTSTLVDSDPVQPGEYTWVLGRDGVKADFVYYNGAPSGVVVDGARAFRLYMQVYTNPYLGRFSKSSFDAHVLPG